MQKYTPTKVQTVGYSHDINIENKQFLGQIAKFQEFPDMKDRENIPL